ncbi:signal transduction histidine kinase [Caulobacter sp. AP07]|uniref:response regulator n=1 Tax=Caulobacter sp. AP07 TaxID=1144304 RepID=UPI0002722503|nr:response regulator [Caulobacter sp. AP07]EJL34439.1 signal transduction histidine kinase [Caulobacter sp. AP07]
MTWDSLAEAYRPAAISHRRQIPLRLFVILVVCVVMAWRPAFSFMVPWAAACIVAQIAEQQALRHFLTRPAPGRAVAFNLTTDVLLAMVFGWLAIPLWQVGTPVASAGAVLVVSGSVLTALMGAEGCVAAFVAAVTPHITYMFVLPLVAGSRHDPVTPYFLIGVSLFSLVLGLVFAWSRRTFEAERAARRAAEAQTAAKSAFVAMVSHELRTPLGAILSGAGDLSRDDGGALARDKAALIADAGAMMRSLLDDLLDYSKIEAGQMSVETLDFDPRALVDDTIRFWRAGARAKGLSLRMTGGDDLPDWLRGDPMRIRQVLNNLLSNAIKFTAEGQVEIAVEARRQGGAWLLTLSVTDTGPGLSPDQLARLFTAYDQLGADTARTFGGTGLGLSISRDLALLMGGDLVAQSAPAGGARFVLTVPTPEGVAPAAEPAPAPAVFAGAPRALVVDDHEVNRRVLDQILGALGLQVELAGDGEAALAVAGERRFDVILMDVNMPGLDGLDTTRRLRTEGPNRRTPVIAVTAGVSSAERSACLAAGMDGWVEKPFEVAGLHAALSLALEVRG